jgi:hypothetical protein
MGIGPWSDEDVPRQVRLEAGAAGAFRRPGALRPSQHEGHGITLRIRWSVRAFMKAAFASPSDSEQTATASSLATVGLYSASRFASVAALACRS